MNKVLSKYFPRYSNEPKKKKVIEEDAAYVNSHNQLILDSILEDNDNKFLELILESLSYDSDPNQVFTCPKYKFPEILENKPTIACLCAFFGSERCFEALCTLLPGGCDSDEMMKLDDWKRSPVHFACAGGSLTILRKLANSGHELDLPDRDGCIPSFYAAMAGQLSILKYLWTKGVEILACWRFKNSPNIFEIACIYGQTKIARFLYEEVSPNLSDDNKEFLIQGQSFNMVKPFHLAMHSGNVELVDYLLSVDEITINQINAVDDKGYTPLCYACLYGNLRIVKKLVNSRKVKISNFKNARQVPLVVAASNCHTDIVNYLIKQRSILIREENSKHINALFAAVLNDDFNTTKLLLINGGATNCEKENTELFYIAVQNQSLETMVLLDEMLQIPYQSPHNRKNTSFIRSITWGDIFMQQACLFEDIGIATFLESKGCNFNRVDLSFNVKHHWNQFMDFLIDKGVNLSDRYSLFTPLIVEIIENGNHDILMEYISKGVELNRSIISEYDCIFLACRKGKLKMFNFLMEYEPKIDILRCINECMLQYTEKKQLKNGGKKYIYMIEKIIESQRIDFDSNNEKKMLLIMNAANLCILKVLQIFGKYGADFTHCKLDYSKMISADYLPIYQFLEENGCKFDNPVYNDEECSSALASLFMCSKIENLYYDVVDFLLKYSSREDVLGFNNSRGNITDNLMISKHYDLIAKTFQIAGSVILPTDYEQMIFNCWVRSNHIQSLIQFLDI